jgi:diguanylate cyclase (GGDEF)-like protein/PAS domain S-box-containing protein
VTVQAGVALQPVLDLSDRRIIAYEVQARPLGIAPRAVVDAALKATTLQLAAPLLVPLPPALLLADADFDPCALARAAHVAPARVVWMLPVLASGALSADVARSATELKEHGFRIGLDRDVLGLSWRAMAELMPSFLTLNEDLNNDLEGAALGAALAGLLGVAGHIGSCVVARGVDTEGDADTLMRIGLVYGLGRYLQGPVVTNAKIAAEGDQLEGASWFKAQSVGPVPEKGRNRATKADDSGAGSKRSRIQMDAPGEPVSVVGPAAGGGDVEDQHRRLEEAQRIARIGSFEMDLDSGELEWSAELRRLLGVPVDERATVAGVIERIHPDDLESFANSINAWVKDGSRRYERSLRLVRDDGVTRQIHMRERVRTLHDGRRILSGTLQDVTERQESEAARRIAEEQFSLAFDQGAIGMLTQSLDRVITRVNPAFCALLGGTPEDIVGKTPDDFTHPDDLAAGVTSATPELLTSHNGRLEVERRFLRVDGSTVNVRGHLTLVRDGRGEPQYVFIQVEDITARRRQDAEILRLTLEDPVTGLPNRQLLFDRMDRSLRRARRSEEKVAVLLVGIDHFKRVNDSLGQAGGDRLLRQAARRMADGMRAHDTVARLSGDEFVLLCEGVEDVNHALSLCERLTSLFTQPFLLDDHEMYVTVSCGIKLAGGSEAPDDLLRDAEAALHLAKDRGRERSEVFDESIRTQATGRLDFEAALRRAVEHRDITVAFQPIVNLPDETIVGVEALARWNLPGRGMVNPAEFISLAEHIGLIGQLGENMLDAALEQVAVWRREIPGWKSMYVAVNLSPKQLVATGLLERCLKSLACHHLEPDSLRLEVTESTVMDDAEFSTRILRGLSEAGILIALDDFGTGFSSLSRLKRLPVATLKIDRSFVDGLGSDPSDSSIVHAIASLGHALNLELCAEGVEQTLQRDELIRLSCHQAQGYLWSPALPAAEFEAAFAPRSGSAGELATALKGPTGNGGVRSPRTRSRLGDRVVVPIGRLPKPPGGSIAPTGDTSP